MNNDKLPCKDFYNDAKPLADICPAIRELKNITVPVERDCEFKELRACRLYAICIRRGFRQRENTVNDCTLYWRQKVERAQKRLGII